jgi:hypothetical protein
MPLVRTDARHLPHRDHHVIELQVRVLVEGDGELQRRRVLGPRDQADLVHVHRARRVLPGPV